MEQVGVEAVVEGLTSFLGDMGKMDSSIQSLIPGAGLLESAFSGLGNVLEGLASGVFRTIEYAIGNLIADAVEYLSQQLQQLVSDTIDAGNEFQTLTLRLTRLNFNDKFNELGDYNQAQEEAVKLTKEQLTWLSKLAATTPYDNTDIANTYTLARSYGFADDVARGLVETITNFASGMGLGATEINRVIVNLGQMEQQGKATQREMNDLARGAFVPVNDILDIMKEKTGLTGAAFDDFRKSAEGVQSFMDAFTELVKTRFQGAAQDMAKTFQGATDNVKDFVKSLFGLNVVKPILDVIGSSLADFMNSLTTSENWDKATAATQSIGESLTRIVRALFSLGPGPAQFADMVILGLQNIADWLDQNSGVIVNWIFNAYNTINTQLIPALAALWQWLFGTDTTQGAIQQFGAWLFSTFVPMVMQAAHWVGNVLVPFLVNDLVPVFQALIPLGTAVAGVILAAMGVKPNVELSSWIHDILIPAILALTDWINKNRDMLAQWLVWLAKLIIIINIAAWIAGMIAKVIAAIVVIGSIIAIMLAWADVILAVMIGAIMILYTALVVYLVGYLIGPVINAIKSVLSWFQSFGQKIRDLAGIFYDLTDLLSRNINWEDVGFDMLSGIVAGINGNAWMVADAMWNMAQEALDAVMNVFDMHSPSKAMSKLGSLTMQGMAQGIIDSAGLVSGAMQSAMIKATAPAMAAPQIAQSFVMAPATASNVQTTNNYNLSINSSANTEPIIQDFDMLSSLAGS